MFVYFCADLQRTCIDEDLKLLDLAVHFHAYVKSYAWSQGGFCFILSGVISVPASSVSSLRKEYFQR